MLVTVQGLTPESDDETITTIAFGENEEKSVSGASLSSISEIDEAAIRDVSKVDDTSE